VTLVLVCVIALLLVAVVILSVAALHGRDRTQPLAEAGSPARILFPFVAPGLAPRALDAALRLARAEHGTLVPVFLARVGQGLPLETPLPRQSAVALPMQEAIEQRARAFGVPVDSRIERGRSLRHALRQTIEHERFDRIVIAAATGRGPGFDADDIAWLLNHAPGEIVVLRPDPDREVDLPAGPVRATRRLAIIGGRPQAGRRAEQTAG
jgi:hypothetical protein